MKTCEGCDGKGYYRDIDQVGWPLVDCEDCEGEGEVEEGPLIFDKVDVSLNEEPIRGWDTEKVDRQGDYFPRLREVVCDCGNRYLITAGGNKPHTCTCGREL